MKIHFNFLPCFSKQNKLLLLPCVSQKICPLIFFFFICHVLVRGQGNRDVNEGGGASQPSAGLGFPGVVTTFDPKSYKSKKKKKKFHLCSRTNPTLRNLLRLTKWRRDGHTTCRNQLKNNRWESQVEPTMVGTSRKSWCSALKSQKFAPICVRGWHQPKCRCA